MMMHRFSLALAACLTASPAFAGTGDDVAQLDILPGWRTADGTHMAAFRLTLSPGWKTYWRAPGDAGIPPQFDWSGSENVATARFNWPVPDVLDQNGMRSIGYHDGVIIPVEIEPTRAGAPVRMTGMVDIGVCLDICVPVSLSFDATLPMTTKRDTNIVASLLDRPQTAQEAGVSHVTCAITPISDGLTVTTTITLPPAGGPEVVIMEPNDPQIWVSESVTHRQGNTLTATSDMLRSDGAAFALDRSSMRITVLGQHHAVDIRGCAAG